MSRDTITETMKILKPTSLPTNIGSADFFTGSVTVAPVMQGEDPSCLACGCVSFEPSSRSAWHTHPKGQLLIVVEGSGLIQQWGEPVRKMEKGDVIWTPPNVKHWHGASSTTKVSHLAVQESLNGKNVEWLEKVSDEQYSAAK